MLLAGVWRFGWSLEALPPPEVLVVLTGFDGLLLLSWPLQWEASALSSGEERKEERKKEGKKKKKLGRVSNLRLVLKALLIYHQLTKIVKI